MVIALIALIVVGPEQLPSVLRRVGQQVAQIRDITTSVRDEFMSGVDDVNPVNWVEKNDAVPMRNKKSGAGDPPTQAELIAGLEQSELDAEQAALGDAASQDQAELFRAKAAAAKADGAKAETASDDASAGEVVPDEGPEDEANETGATS